LPLSLPLAIIFSLILLYYALILSFGKESKASSFFAGKRNRKTLGVN